MQYYKEYLNNSSIYGKLIFKNDKYYVNDNEINNNRGIVNDEVYISNQDVVGIKKPKVLIISIPNVWNINQKDLEPLKRIAEVSWIQTKKITFIGQY